MATHRRKATQMALSTKKVSQEAINTDHRLTAEKARADGMAAAADRALDQHRYEQTLCPDGPQYSPTDYGKEVGVSAQAILVSARAWQAHGIGCSVPAHAKSASAERAAEEAKTRQPEAKEHAKSRVKAMHGGEMAEAMEVVSEVFGKSLGNVSGHYREQANRSRHMAKDIADSEGRSVTREDLWAAAQQIKAEFDADKALRRKIYDGLRKRNTIMGEEPSEPTKAQVSAFLQDVQEKFAVASRAGLTVSLADMVNKAIARAIEHAEAIAAAKARNSDWIEDRKRREAIVDAMFAGNKAVDGLRFFWANLDRMEEAVKIDSGLTEDDLRAFRSLIVMAQCWITSIEKRLAGDADASYRAELDAYNTAHAGESDFEAILTDDEIFAFLDEEAGRR